MTNYIVTHKDETTTRITNANDVRQVFRFLQFLDEDGDLILALNVDDIAYYAPEGTEKPVSVPTVQRLKPGTSATPTAPPEHFDF